MAEVPNYYIISGHRVPRPTSIKEGPELPGGPWMHGRRITIAVPEPLRYALDPAYPGDLQPMYKFAVPLMRDDLIEALRAGGGDNLETFRAVLRDVEGKEHQNYKAFNVVGVVSCANMAKSGRMGTPDNNLIDADFDRVVLDESKAGGLLMFRLAEAVNAIVVHRQLKEAIEARKIKGMKFYGPGEWSG